MRDEFANLGVTFEEEAEPTSEPDAVEVWSTNWESLSAFLACATQWRALAGADKVVWLGLDYPGVDVVLRRLRCKNHVFADLQAMEAEALKAFGEAAE